MIDQSDWVAQCRFIGTPHVLFSTYKASVAASHVALTPSRYLPSTADAYNLKLGRPPPHVLEHGDVRHAFPKFSAANERWGKEYILIEPITPWEEHPDEGARAVERCERLYQAFLEKEDATGREVNGITNEATDRHIS